MTKVTQDGRLAASLLDARRRMGLTVAGLADDARVPLRVVEAAERGGGLPYEAVPAVLGTLGLDPAPYLDLPPGQAAVRAMDRDHARTMAYLARVTDGEEGWLLHPDVASVPRVGDCTDAELARARQVAYRSWAVPRTSWHRAGSVVMHVAVGLGVTAGVAFVLFALAVLIELCMGQARSADLVLLACPAVVALLCWLSFEGVHRAYPDDGAERQEALRDLEARRAASKASAEVVATGSRTGFMVSREGVTTLVTGADGLARRDYRVEAFRSVDVRDEDDGHVTVEVDSVVGRVTMPWLPRSRTLSDLVAGWRRRCDAVPEGGLQ